MRQFLSIIFVVFALFKINGQEVTIEQLDSIIHYVDYAHSDLTYLLDSGNLVTYTKVQATYLNDPQRGEQLPVKVNVEFYKNGDTIWTECSNDKFLFLMILTRYSQKREKQHQFYEGCVAEDSYEVVVQSNYSQLSNGSLLLFENDGCKKKGLYLYHLRSRVLYYFSEPKFVNIEL